jgi:transcriptional regulator with XRE-family HTH domain
VFKDNLKRIRAEKGFTQARLAEAMKCPLRNVQNWEQGHREPSLQTLREIAGTLGVSLAELLEGEPPTKKVKAKK